MGLKLEQDLIDWLLEPEDAGARYLALRILGDKKELKTAARQAYEKGQIGQVLSHMQKGGYWEKPGAGYYPKYTGTVWSVILLAQLGASVEMDNRISTACSCLLEQNLMKSGQFTINGLPSGTVDCVQGNLCSALLDLGCKDSRLDKAFEWMARSVTGEGVAPMKDKNAAVRYYAGKCGPGFICGANNKVPCAWGATKVMLAFSKLSSEKRTALIDNAIQAGIDFLFSTDPARADYPSGYSNKPSGNWWKFGFPVFYVTDLLQVTEVLVRLGYGKDPRLAESLKIINNKRDSRGRWMLEYDYTGKTWGDFGIKKQPNKWVTLRALHVFNSAGLYT